MPELLKRQQESDEEGVERSEMLQPIDSAEIERQIEEFREQIEAYNREAEAQIQAARNLGSTALS